MIEYDVDGKSWASENKGDNTNIKKLTFLAVFLIN